MHRSVTVVNHAGTMASLGLGSACFSFRLAVLVALISLGCTSRPRMQPFFDPVCLANNCSWSWQSPVPGDQFCERTSTADNRNICPNNFGRPDSLIDRPPEAGDVQVVDLETNFTSLETGANGQYTCLSITYTITKSAAEKVKGLQLSVRGLDLPDQGMLYCLTKNFSSEGLHRYAVRDVVFANHCFCGIKPGRDYEVSVRTLPLDDSGDDPYVPMRYAADGCHVSTKHNDLRCLNSVEARWEPACIVAEQQTQTGDYGSVVIWFDVAPADYNFDRYKVFVYKYINDKLGGPPVGYKDVRIPMMPEVIVTRTCPMSLEPQEACRVVFDSASWTDNFDGVMFVVRVEPEPSVSQCLDAELSPLPNCKISQSKPFSLITDPCIGNPCSPDDGESVGNCTSQEERYFCHCVDGHRVFEHKCIADPCKLMESSGSWSTQCANGVCAYIPDQTDFYCYCNMGYILANPKKCIADPCAMDPATNLTVCGPHGDCLTNLTMERVSHTCVCQEGYEVSAVQGACKATGPLPGLIIGVVITSCASGFCLFFLLFCLFRNRDRVFKKYVETPTPPQIGRVGRELPRQDHCQQFVSVPGRRRVLPIYSDDHPLHKEVVQCFCRLLQQHCSCEVSLIDWQSGGVGPSVEMWLSAEMDRADLVLLLCSKGTGVKYKDRANLRTPAASPGVNGDVFVKSLALLDDYLHQNNAHAKFAVAYFDYSEEADIPVTLRRLGRYRLMQHMEALYLRVHGLGKDSPHSTRRVNAFKEAQYANLEMGGPLCLAIEDMKAMVKSRPRWYQEYNMEGRDAEATPFRAPLIAASLDPQVSMDSAYDSGDMPRAPPGFFSDVDSLRSSSASSDFEESLQKLRDFPSRPGIPAAVPAPPQSRLFSQDIGLNFAGDSGNPFQSGSFFSDIQMGGIGPHAQARPGSSA